MGKDIGFGPAHKVEPRPCRQEIEAGLRQIGAAFARQPAIQRLALLSAVAVLRDLIPAYRIRPPTDKELKMQVSKDVEVLREFERKLLQHYEQAVATLQQLVKE